MHRNHLLRLVGGCFSSLGAAALAACDSAPQQPPQPQPQPQRPAAAPAAAAPAAHQLDKNPRHFALDVLLHECRDWDAAGLERTLPCATMRERLLSSVIISGSTNPSLADEVAYEAGTALGAVTVSRFPDGECNVKLDVSLRGKDVYIVQSSSPPINDALMEALLLCSAARRASARTVTLLAPSMPYGRSTGSKTGKGHSEEGLGVFLDARGLAEEDSSSGSVSSAAGGLPRALKALLASHSDSSSGSSDGSADADAVHARLRSEGLAASAAAAASVLLSAAAREGGSAAAPQHASALAAGASETNSISAADCALMLVASGVDRIISVELSPPGTGQTEGFFPPHVPVESLRASGVLVDFLAKFKLARPTVVAPNEDCLQLAMDIRAGMQHKMPGVEVGLACIVEMAEPGGKEAKLQLIGDVSGREAILCDHLIDSARTLEQRVKLLKRAGAGRCVAVATHGIFSGRALQRISRSSLSDCVITNTVPLRDDVDVRDLHKLSQLSVAPLLASAIIRAQCDLSYQPAQPGMSTASARYAGQGE